MFYIIINCFMMFEGGSNLVGLHMVINFSKLNSFQNCMIGQIAIFILDYIMYEGMELRFNQKHQVLYIP